MDCQSLGVPQSLTRSILADDYPPGSPNSWDGFICTDLAMAVFMHSLASSLI